MISKFKLKKKQKNKKKKGFTLIELLAVIVILAVIMIITIPTVIGSMNNAKLKAEEIFIASIEKSLNDFIEKELQYSDYYFNEDKDKYIVSSIKNDYGYYDVRDNNSKFITLSDLIEKEYLNNDSLINPKDSSVCNDDVIVHFQYDKINKKYYYKTTLNCANIILSNIPGPEEPYLSNGLIPVVYNNENKMWEVADTSTKWYDYHTQNWANAVSVTEASRSQYKNLDNSFNSGTPIPMNDILAMFVWIPRFSYTIGCTDDSTCLGHKIYDGTVTLDLSTELPGAIDIKFNKSDKTDTLGTISKNNLPNYKYDASKLENRVSDKWYTHPAFEFNGKQISGFWVGKFLTSINTSSNNNDCYYYLNRLDLSNAKTKCESSRIKNSARILPGKISLTSQSIQEQFESSRDFSESNNVYGITGNSHLIKNSEWAAVAYLSQSIYGKYGNPAYMNEHKEIYKNNSAKRITGKSSGIPPSSGSIDLGTCDYNDLIQRDNGYGSCGGGASTTGNIYGVYDMVGGVIERVMGVYYAPNFTIEQFYYDVFSIDNPVISPGAHIDIKKNSTVGYSFFETDDWYGDNAIPSSYYYFNKTNFRWVNRSGDDDCVKCNVFTLSRDNGAPALNIGFHIALVNETL